MSGLNSTASPFPAIAWPPISSVDQDIILNSLLQALRPIGIHRRANIRPSKGKRAQQRQKKAEAVKLPAIIPLSKPEITNHVTIGFNSTIGALQRQARAVIEEQPLPALIQDIVAVVACKDTLPDLLTSLLPQIVLAASVAAARGHAVRLVALPGNAEQELALAVGLPRVGVIGLRECTATSTLLSLITEKVLPIHVPWVEQKPQYLPLKTNFQEPGRRDVSTT